jgi:hypothetical protein
VKSEHFVLIFFFMFGLLLALLWPVVLPGLAHVLSKIWRGQSRFEQMVNTLTYTQVPSLLIQSFLNDWILTGIPVNLLFSQPYGFAAAMNGVFGPV